MTSTMAVDKQRHTIAPHASDRVQVPLIGQWRRLASCLVPEDARQAAGRGRPTLRLTTLCPYTVSASYGFTAPEILPLHL